MADKMPTVKELRGLPAAELQSHIEKLQQDMWQHRLKAREGSLQQTHLLSRARRQIARLRTIQREQQA